MPGGYGRTSEQADAASGPVPKHPGPPPSYLFLLASFGLAWLNISLFSIGNFGTENYPIIKSAIKCWLC